MQAIILAAGLGDRLGSYTSNKPKAMAEVAGKTLISRCFDFLGENNFSSITVVTGYMSELLSNHVTSLNPKVKIATNSHYRKGNILSLAAAMEQVNDGFLLMNADHIYPRRMLNKIMEPAKNITAVCDFDRKLGDDDMKVKLSPDKTISQISKKLSNFDCGYIGMTICPKEKLTSYKNAFASALEDEGDTIHVERILGRIAASGNKVEIRDASGFGWLEVDTPEELKLAEKTINSKADFLS